MTTVYILYSKEINKHYIGSCKDFIKRYEQHVKKSFVGYTNNASDWKLLFKIDDLGYSPSRRIELHIKKMKSRRYILNLMNYPEMVEKLIIKHQ